MEQAQKLIMNQHSTVMKDPFPQGQNATSTSKDVGGTSSSPTDHNYINMVRSNTFLHNRNKNYELKVPEKGKSTTETSTPLTNEKSTAQ